MVVFRTWFSLVLFSLQPFPCTFPICVWSILPFVSEFLKVWGLGPSTSELWEGESKMQVPCFYLRPTQSTFCMGTGNLCIKETLQILSCPTSPAKVGTISGVKEGLEAVNNCSSTPPSGGFLIPLSQFGKQLSQTRKLEKQRILMDYLFHE